MTKNKIKILPMGSFVSTNIQRKKRRREVKKEPRQSPFTIILLFSFTHFVLTIIVVYELQPI